MGLCIVFGDFGEYGEYDGEVGAAELLGFVVVDVAVTLGDYAFADGKAEA